MEITVDLLCELFRYRWSAPILAELGRSRGCKYVTLNHRLGVADGPLRQALDWQIGRGWVVRNPGYGHPSRPEYVLTEEGAILAPRCGATIALLDSIDAGRAGLNRWTVPLVYTLSAGASRFGEIRPALCGISPRALSQSLREVMDADLASRHVAADIPVLVTYALTGTGDRLAGIWV